MIVGSAACRAEHANLLRQQGFACQEADDPYQAMFELTRPAAVYRALVLSLSSLYREELQMIGVVKRTLPGVEIWLTNTEGRVAAMAEAMRLGADGVLAVDGFHRTSSPTPADQPTPIPEAPALVPQESGEASNNNDDESPATSDEFPSGAGEPVLSAEELRALLQDQPVFPPEEQSR
jgi:hypothetical protein